MAELKEAFGSKIESTLIRGDNGIFDVVLDGHKIYSKKETGRFPGYREIPSLIEQKLLRE